MSKVKFRLCLVCLCATFYNIETSAQNNSFENDSIIYWSESRKLVWDDFQGEKDTSQFNNKYGVALAISVVDIIFSYSSKHIIVFASFDKKDSWTVTESKDVLGHEQLHFDIAELFARKIRKAFSELKKNNVSDYSVYDSIFVKYTKEMTEYNNKFDKNTLGVSAEKSITEEGEEYALIESEDSEIYILGQKYWREKVAKELKELEEYSSPFIK